MSTESYGIESTTMGEEAYEQAEKIAGIITKYLTPAAEALEKIGHSILESFEGLESHEKRLAMAMLKDLLFDVELKHDQEEEDAVKKDGKYSGPEHV